MKVQVQSFVHPSAMKSLERCLFDTHSEISRMRINTIVQEIEALSQSYNESKGGLELTQRDEPYVANLGNFWIRFRIEDRSDSATDLVVRKIVILGAVQTSNQAAETKV
jgi:hypothetical protein